MVQELPSSRIMAFPFVMQRNTSTKNIFPAKCSSWKYYRFHPFVMEFFSRWIVGWKRNRFQSEIGRYAFSDRKSKNFLWEGRNVYDMLVSMSIVHRNLRAIPIHIINTLSIDIKGKNKNMIHSPSMIWNEGRNTAVRIEFQRHTERLQGISASGSSKAKPFT